jgi:hypothetical protein
LRNVSKNKNFEFSYNLKRYIIRTSSERVLRNIQKNLLLTWCLCSLFKGIRQYIFLLFHFKELFKLYVNLLYRFCVTLLFLEIFWLKIICCLNNHFWLLNVNTAQIKLLIAPRWISNSPKHRNVYTSNFAILFHITTRA